MTFATIKTTFYIATCYIRGSMDKTITRIFFSRRLHDITIIIRSSHIDDNIIYYIDYGV